MLFRTLIHHFSSIKKLYEGKIEFEDITAKFMARLEGAAKGARERNTYSGPGFNFAVANSQIDSLSDQIDAIGTVADNIEGSFLDPTPHLTTEVIEVDDIDRNLADKNKLIKHMGKKIACESSEAYLEG